MLKKVIFAVVAMTAFFIAIGSIGAYDSNTITALRCVLQVLGCVCVECFALKIINE